MRNLVASIPEVDTIIVYHPDDIRFPDPDLNELNCSIETTSNFDNLLLTKAVLICSPSNTHFDYLKELSNNGKYVLCEKPISVTSDQLHQIASLPVNRKAYIYTNHNYAFTAFNRYAEILIREQRAGDPLHLEFCASHGLSYQRSAADNWRFLRPDPFDSIVGNLGIHYIHMALRLFGDIVEITSHRGRGNPNSKEPDTCTILMRAAGGQTINIFLSYAAPYTNTARLVLTDGLLELNDGYLVESGPRTTFDNDNRFTTPPNKVLCNFDSSKAYTDESIMLSLQYFLRVVGSSGSFPSSHLDLAIRSAQMVLELHCKGHDVGIIQYNNQDILE